VVATLALAAFVLLMVPPLAILRVVAFLRSSRPRLRAMRGIADGTGRAQAATRRTHDDRQDLSSDRVRETTTPELSPASKSRERK
jgi:hypothetical protein